MSRYVVRKICSRCKSAQFDESKYGGRASRSANGNECLKLDVLRYGQEGFETRIKRFTALDAGLEFEDDYPGLPDMRERAENCDFCAFLCRGLGSKEVRLAITDQAEEPLDLTKRSIRIGVALKYSWEPEFHDASHEETDIGLDALYVYVVNIDAQSSSATGNPILPKGVICSLRFAVTEDCYRQEQFTHWLRIRKDFEQTQWNEMYEKFIKLQLYDCHNGLGQHTYCQNIWQRMESERKESSDSKYAFLPKRLIDVHSKPPRLVESANVRHSHAPHWLPRYAALSYCWGDKEDAALQLQLRSDNETELKDQLPLESLSKVQRDAIVLTRDVDVHYLWNDALCIKQDDRFDWQDEAMSMARIYQYAAFTIVSTQATSREPLFDSIAAFTSTGYRSSIRPSIHSRYRLEFDGVETRSHNAHTHYKLSKDLVANRWLTRGWTFQEQNHSLRMLLWSSHELRFICPCSNKLLNPAASLDFSPILQQSPWYRWSSEFPEEFEDEIDEETYETSFTVAKQLYGPSRLRYDHLRILWLRFAAEYSLRIFTKPADMYPALFATASLFDKRLPDRYLNGIWKDDPWGFMWRYKEVDPPHSSLGYCRGHYSDNTTGSAVCSWSWVGKRGITFLRPLFDDILDDLFDWRKEYELDDNQVETIMSSPRMGYSKCLLEFTGKRTERRTAYHNAERGEKSNEVTVSLNWKEDRFHCSLDWQNVHIKTKLGHDDEIADFVYGTSFMLLASARVRGRRNRGRAAAGLILVEQSNASGQDHFYRCGIFVSLPTGEYKCGGMFNFDEYEEETFYVN